MLSTFTIISIFTEIFATGILLAGAYNFFARFLELREKKDFFLSAVFLSFALYAALTVASQIMYNMGRPLSELIIIHKLIYFDITTCSLFLWYFTADKFGYAKSIISKAISAILTIIVIGIISSISFSGLNLVYRREVIEPIASFSFFVPSRILWVVMWGMISVLSFWNIFGSGKARRNLLLLTGFSSALIVLAYVLKVMYVGSADSTFLLLSWVVTLFSVTGLLLGEIIPASSQMALAPLTFFKARILYKLILIFVLLIVVLLEVTTLVTINISRDSLVQSTKDYHKSIAQNISDKIEYGGIKYNQPNLEFIQELVNSATTGSRIVYVVDSTGRIIVHPQPEAVGKNLKNVISVKKVLAGESGSLEYVSPLFIVPDDQVVGSFSPVKGSPIGVIVEEPKAYAYTEIRKVETNSLIFVITGIILTIFVGIFFAKSIERPIKEMIIGTEAVRKGNLSQKIKIDSSDEVGQLASAFNQMTADLKETQEHLVSSEKLAALGTMAAGMAHEIKNPLVSLRTFTQLLQQKFDDPEYRRKFTAIVPQEIEHINKIAESLLKFGKPTKPELAQVNTNKLLEEVLELLENECRRNNIRITTKLATIPEITGDAMQLSQALVNIVLNAIQAMPKGGELTVKTDVGEVIRLGRSLRKEILKGEGIYREGLLAEEGEKPEQNEEPVSDRPVPVIFIEISDTGKGIVEENLKSLFDPFYTTKISGTGMGLPITLRIIEDHKGSIKVKSKIDKGTTFIVTLPQKLEEV